MSRSQDELRTLFDSESAEIKASAEFDLELNEELTQRRKRRVAGTISLLLLCALIGFAQWPQKDVFPVAEDPSWVASLDSLWMQHDAELDDLLVESEWTETEEWPSEYQVFAQLIDETEDKETIQ